MNLTKYVIRGILLLLLVVNVIVLNRRTDNAIGQVARFKLETLKKIKADTLDAPRKLTVMIDETSRFTDRISEESPYVKTGMRYVILLVGCMLITEVVFFVARRRKLGSE